MSPNNIKARFEPIRSLAFGDISGTYAAVGTPLENPSRLPILSNFTNANLIISFDGTTDHLIIGAGVAQVLDISSDRSDQAGVLEISANTTIYIKQESGAASSGSFYVSSAYASNS